MKEKFTRIFLLFMLFTGVTVSAQVKDVTGKITSTDDGLGLPGVTIKIKGAAGGTSTNGNGNFSLKVPNNNSILVISLIGYLTKEVSVENKNTITVALETDSKQLQEVTVSTALGITRQARSLGYAAQGVKAQDLTFNHQPNMINALQGKVAGATISSIGGGPGQGATIRIRGVNSIDAGISGDPLYVIDGVQMDNSTSTLGATNGTDYGARGVSNRASDINPDDIETINILKGGAATALYGLRGANGVVVITTKKAKQNGVSVNYSSSFGIDEVLKKPKVQKEFTQGVLGVYTNPPSGIGPAWGPTIAEAKLIDPTHPDKLYENYDQAFGTGQQIKNSVSLAGGSDFVKVYSSISQFYQKGMMPNTDYNNYSARLNADLNVSTKFKVSVNTNFTNTGGYTYAADRYGEGIAYWSPRYDMKDYLKPDGTQNYIGTNNPIYGTATNKLKNDLNRFVGGAAVTYTPTSWLSFAYRFGLDTYNENRLRTAPGKMGITGEASYDNDNGYVGEYNTKFRTINSTFIATFNTKITDDINATLRVGQELYNKRAKSIGVLGSELSVYNYYNLTNAKLVSTSSNLVEKRLVGYFGEATFDYKNYIFLTLTGRNDVTSTLSSNNRSFFYPSASLSYVLTDQFKFPKAVSMAKLRLSYAEIGKDAVEYLTSTGFTNYASLPTGITGFTNSATLGNPDLRPEFTKTYEAGLEMSFLNNRIGFDLSYYYSLSTDQIIRSQISSAVGYVNKAINAGDIRNQGIELVLNGKPIVTDNFKLTK